MELKTLKVLHIQMQALTRTVEEYAKQLAAVTWTISRMAEDEKKAMTGKKEWYVPENDYGTLVRLLTTEPWLMEHLRKYHDE